ncbi:MAG TPA: hypothetical protein DCM71_02830 [Runella sp.]|nr:hypothetical protein [Runella sp.]
MIRVLVTVRDRVASVTQVVPLGNIAMAVLGHRLRVVDHFRGHKVLPVLQAGMFSKLQEVTTTFWDLALMVVIQACS